MKNILRFSLTVAVFTVIITAIGFTVQAPAWDPTITVNVAAPVPGSIDDTQVLQNAIDNAPPYCRLVLAHNQTYLIKADTAVINGFNVALYINKPNLEIDLNGSTIKLVSNDYEHYSLIFIDNAEGIIIHNSDPDHIAALQGDRMTHTSCQWGHGIYSYGSDTTVDNIEIFDMAADGIYIKEKAIQGEGNATNDADSTTVTGDNETAFDNRFKIGDAIQISPSSKSQIVYVAEIANNELKTSKITNAHTDSDYNYFSKSTVSITNCAIHHCGRIGIAVIGVDAITIDHCDIFKIGTWNDVNGNGTAIPGCNPQAGINIEPTLPLIGSMKINNFILTNSNIKECTNYGLVCRESDRILNATIDNLNTSARCVINLENLELRNSNVDFANIADSRIWCKTALNCTFTSKSTDINTLINLSGEFSDCDFYGSNDGVHKTSIVGYYSLNNPTTIIFNNNCTMTDITQIYSTTTTDCIITWTNSGLVKLLEGEFIDCEISVSGRLQLNGVCTDCTIVAPTSVVLSRGSYINCYSTDTSNLTITAQYCHLQGPNIMGNAIKNINNCTVVLDELTNSNLFNDRILRYSTLKITDQLDVDKDNKLKYLPTATYCVFNLNSNNEGSAMPPQCGNSYIDTGPQIHQLRFTGNR